MSRKSSGVMTLLAVLVVGIAIGGTSVFFAYILPDRLDAIQARNPAPTSAAPGGTTVPPPATVDPVLAPPANNEIIARDQTIIDLYETVSPSVVHIVTRTQTLNPFYGITSREGSGSGFVYDDQGHIITNFHVIEGADDVDVLLADGTSVPGRVIGTDAYYDLAVLRIETPGDMPLTPLGLGDSDTLRVGQTVVAIGNPFGLDRTLTTGTVSALGRRLETEAGALIGQAIQTDAAINPGNSGGPLLNTAAQVVGINTAINSPTGASVGIGFAVPSNVARRVVPQLIETGSYQHPSLGVEVLELGTEVRATGDVRRGLLVIDMTPGGSAAQAGLQAAQITRRAGRYVIRGGDIITAIDGTPVASRSDMLLFLDEHYRPGDSATLTIARDGRLREVTVTVGAQ